MKKIINIILSLILPFLTLSILLLILHLFKSLIKYPFDLFLAATAINASAIIGYWRLSFIKKMFYILIGILYFPIFMYVLNIYLINFVCFAFGDCV